VTPVTDEIWLTSLQALQANSEAIVDITSGRDDDGPLDEIGAKKRRLNSPRAKRVRFTEDIVNHFDTVEVTIEEGNTEENPASDQLLLHGVFDEKESFASDAENDITSQLCTDCSKSQQVAQLHEIIETLEIKIQRLEHQIRSGQTPSPEPTPPRLHIFHKVVCECNTAERFGQTRRTTYTDPPYRMTVGRRWHLQGHLNAPEESVFLEQNKDVVLLVYKYYRCKGDAARFQWQGGIDKEAFASGMEAGAPMPYQESMTINSDILREALSWASSESESPGSMERVDLHVEIFSPYHYLYHDRHFLGEKVGIMDEEHQTHVNILMDYVKTSFESSYNEASNLFSQGLVSYETILYLYEPKMYVVAEKNGDILAYETVSWLTSDTDRENPEEDWNLECWSWKFDGSLRKSMHTFQFGWPWSTRDVKPIQSLTVYPLRYARATLERELHVRGEKFWSCREKIYVSYEDEGNFFEDPVQVSYRNG
jgi:hypothetical protein